MEMMNELSRVGWICEHRDTNIDFSSAWPWLKGRGFDLLWLGGGMRICLGRCTTEDQLN
jgi:hypothetical protein